MTNPTKTRRLPVKICLHPGGTTEVIYGVATEPVDLGIALINEPRSNTLSLSTVARSATATPAATLSGSVSLCVVTGGVARGLAQPPANELSSLRDE